MTSKSILALVVSGSGTLQNGLLALVTTIPPISAVLVAEDINSALRMAENHKPALIILDMSFPDMLDIIKQVKEQCPHVHLIVLVEDTVEEKEVEESGADSVLLKGFSAHKLIAIVDNLIDRQGLSPRCKQTLKDERIPADDNSFTPESLHKLKLVEYVKLKKKLRKQ